MTSLIAVFLTSFMVGLSGALMPGPLLTTTVGESSRSGMRAGPLLIAGHAILEIALIGLLFAGLAPILKDARVTGSISIAGALILVWFAYGMLRSLPRLSFSTQASARRAHGRLILSGILISLSNPYWSIWWATIGLAYIVQSMRWGVVGLGVFFLGHILADLAWYSTISYSVGKGRRFFTPGIYKVLVGVCAVFLAVFAVWFFYDGAKRLLVCIQAISFSG